MGEKVSTMILKVDLQCHRCYKKVKKVLCKFLQIQDQIYDEKHNTVAIKVVSCSPERIRQKIIYKGGNSIQSIEIKPPPKPKTEEKPKPPPAEKPKEAEAKPKDKPAEPVAKPSEPAPFIAVPYYPESYAAGAYSRPYYEGYGGGPYHHGHGEEYMIGRPVYDSYGGGGYRPSYYSSEENPSGCIIM
ncbi:hypothetical protein I3760_10G079800 [Carya illinoinensis]|uniref:protein PYRICULARIA ORYZAE RESISTANCE 21-like isoform X3 n=1 Tax=Carya illinoinensis TaxID=32201 RepID=UPI001BF21FA8|nr:protein PYRICULARIA ORYZAE RESISTANCE 21-like isoform X3 [Carya illinoinensis]KAG2684498.1 hypothetical protein I3760_10G079800 [Carya illinoinensis]